MIRKAIGGPPTAGPYSPAIIADGRFVYVSGQGPFRDGVVVDGTIEEQTELTLANVSRVLDAAGASLRHVVRCGVFLTDLHQFTAMNVVYERFFPHPRPTRTTVGVALMAGMKIEIDCVALLPSPPEQG